MRREPAAPRGRGLAGLGLLVALGCGGAEIRGGHAAPESALGRTTTVLRFVAEDCRDSHERPTMPRSDRVEVVRLASGAAALVEYRAGYDALVVENSFVDGKAQVFQAVVEAEGGAPLLHEFRVPELGNQSGEVRISDHFDVEELSNDGFRARAAGLLSRCVLSPVVEGPSDGDGARDATN